ncbi:hypothetical protein GCM10011282_10810 [Undibacterium macrobrachii]|uniref:Uncharacterized protein n=1 Tax=Undibacterium macrobrachii TaxID=1119058 RepID=A0ABQ2X9N9_9BURK|nr:hypothetical protein GCM10011282_10810 [Undibacterium macrobrachii]
MLIPTPNRLRIKIVLADEKSDGDFDWGAFGIVNLSLRFEKRGKIHIHYKYI